MTNPDSKRQDCQD